MRSYETSTERDYTRKLEMNNKGCYPIFREAGLWQVFCSNTLARVRMPDLTYLPAYPDMTTREK